MTFNNKILRFDDLKKLTNSLRLSNKKIIHCHGVFDLLHIGHIRYFEQAKQMGDVLVVTITQDKYVDKGPLRPAFNESLRSEAVASLNCVDYVAINKWATAKQTLKLLQPDVYVKGSEFKDISSDLTGKIKAEKKIIDELGITLAFTDDIVFSSSNLINQYFSELPEEVDEYLKVFRNRYSLNQVLGYIDKMSNLNVFIVGDAILDEYVYCDAIGKSSKDPIIAVKYNSHEIFAGGVFAIANHVSNFVKKVKLVSVLGENDSHEKFIKSKLKKNISSIFFNRKNAPTLIKKRYIDGYSTNKLFEIYLMDDSDLDTEEDTKICEYLKKELPKYDLVIVADYGHGTISDKMRNILLSKSKFIAVNTQANAGNRGFHSASKYPEADFVCLSEHEIRLELRDTKSEMRFLIDELGKKIKCKKLVVTQGGKGCMVWKDESMFVKVPSFARKAIDRVGAGDAFFSVAALAVAQNVPEEVLGFIGNCMGRLAVDIMGNKEAIDKLKLIKYLVALMK